VLKRSFGVLVIAAVLVACSSAGASVAPSASTASEHDRSPAPTSASPAPSASTVSERELLATFDALAELPGFQVGGLTPAGDEVLVYWHGELGPEAKAAVDEASRHGVVVNVISVPYSYDELREIAGPLVEALAAKGIETEGYQIGDPFDVIAVWGTALDGSAEARRAAEEIAADILPPDLRFAIIASPGPAVLL
jgi:hypothetical protein